MAPVRQYGFRRRSSLQLTSIRRKSLAQPKAFTFAPNLTPGTYPQEIPDGSADSGGQELSLNGLNGGDGSSILEDPLNAGSNGASAATTSSPSPHLGNSSNSRSRRRAARRDEAEHIPRPPNAFMLFRQNFVHQRHVPGSIETNHNSLSKIVGNCWRALPPTERKVWEELAEKKKQEHKKQYPDYRFQPKHDPEKKRKRLEAKQAAAAAEAAAAAVATQAAVASGLGVVEAEKEEKRRAEELSVLLMKGNNGKRGEPSMMKKDIEERENRFKAPQPLHAGHRRSSSVPLPSQPYPIPFGYGNFGYGGVIMPGAPGSSNNNAIALPALPNTNINNLASLVPSWYPNNSGASDQQQHATSGLDLHMPVPQPLNASAPNSQMVSRPASPLLSRTIRAARQHQMGQLGRRASSTQPLLSHQMTAYPGMFNYGMMQQDGGAQQNQGQTNTAPAQWAPSFPPRNSMWYERGVELGVIPPDGDANFLHQQAFMNYNMGVGLMGMHGGAEMGVVAGEAEPLPEVNSSLLNPEFGFGSNANVGLNDGKDMSGLNGMNVVDANAGSGVESGPTSAATSEFSRNSFDFSAFVQSLPPSFHPNGGAKYNGRVVDTAISPLENVAPHEQSPYMMPGSQIQPQSSQVQSQPTSTSDSSNVDSSSNSSVSNSPNYSPHAQPQGESALHAPQPQHGFTRFDWGPTNKQQVVPVGEQVVGPLDMSANYVNMNMVDPNSGLNTNLASIHQHQQLPLGTQELEVVSGHDLLDGAYGMAVPLSASLMTDAAAAASMVGVGGMGVNGIGVYSQHQQGLESYYMGMEATMGVPGVGVDTTTTTNVAHTETTSAATTVGVTATAISGGVGVSGTSSSTQPQMHSHSHGHGAQGMVSSATGTAGVTGLGQQQQGPEPRQVHHQHHHPHSHQHQHQHHQQLQQQHQHQHQTGFEFSDYVHDSPFIGAAA